MSWRDYFKRHPKKDVMYQMFKDRMEAEAQGDTLAETRKEIVERLDREEEENNFCNYEKTEYYREQWAKKKGYEFKPKPYNPDKRYR